jgi:hypothetical protein
MSSTKLDGAGQGETPRKPSPDVEADPLQIALKARKAHLEDLLRDAVDAAAAAREQLAILADLESKRAERLKSRGARSDKQ